MSSLATMDMVLKAVLSQGNKEQNQSYPPRVFESHFRLVTDYLLDEIASLYPTTQKIVDLGRPFMKTQSIAVTGGMIKIPEDMRNLLGISIYVTSDFSSPCAGEEKKEKEDEDINSCDLPGDPLAPSLKQIQEKVARGKCKSQSVNLVDQSEWDSRTQHPYKFPTLEKPIGCLFEEEGIKICPYEVPNVDIRYLKMPKEYQYGYRNNPDDTYVFSPENSVESEWTKNAFQYLVKGITTLYSIYTRDGELRDGVLELKKAGIF